MSDELLANLDRLHSTALGIQRIRKNLGLNVADVLSWCRQQIESADEIVRSGKNWYAHVGDVRITVNAHSYTVITAHRGKVSHPLPAPVHAPQYTSEELHAALQAIDSTIRKCEKAQPKLKAGTSQHTLLVRRIKALQIASALIGREMDSLRNSPTPPRGK